MLPIDPPLAHTKVIGSFFGPYVDGRHNDEIEPLLDRLDEVEGTAQVEAARAILEIEPESQVAYMVLAEHAETGAERVVLLREAVRIGSRLWDEVAADGDVAWWDHSGTRTHMRAIAAYGRAMAAQGFDARAAECFETLIEMNPADPLEVGDEIARGRRPGGM